MSYLRNTLTGAIVGWLAPDSAEYVYLQKQIQPGSSGLAAPLWEDVPWTDAGVGAGSPAAYGLAAAVPASGAAVTTGVLVGAAPVSGRLLAAEYFPSAAIVGADTNSRTLALADLQDASIASLALLAAAGTLAANVGAALPPVDDAATALEINAGDVIKFTSTPVGTGLADPGGLVVVTFAREL